MRFLLLLSMLLFVSSCGKIELPSDDDKPTEDITPSDSTSADKVYAVRELSRVDDDDIVYVKGYIVGYIPKNGTMARAVFGIDEDVVATNIIIADTTTEEDYTQCAPAQLLANSEARISLNLADNPENIGRCVVLCGKKQKYFNSPGLKPVYSFEFVEDEPSQGDDPSASETAFPTISNADAEVFEGC